jgi:hypothetical protein
MVLDIVRPLTETSSGNKYVFVAIDHYSKSCETCHVKEHDAIIVAKFFEIEVTCRFGVPKYILTNIIHQLTAPTWTRNLCQQKFWVLSPNHMKWGEIALMNDLMC